MCLERIEQLKKYKETGFTLTQYVSNQKIIAAKALLKDGHSVTDVALKLSYNSDSHFIEVLNKMTGIMPKKYTQSKKSNHE